MLTFSVIDTFYLRQLYKDNDFNLLIVYLLYTFLYFSYLVYNKEHVQLQTQVGKNIVIINETISI